MNWMSKAVSGGSKAGFTLVELIVVIAILGILAGIAVPVYSGYIDKAGEAADMQLLGAVNTAFAAACAGHNLNPTEVEAGVVWMDNRVTGVTPAELNADFVQFYGDNAKVPFKTFSSIGYDKNNGIFIANGGTMYYTVSLGGKEVTVAVDAEEYANVLASTFGDKEKITMDQLMGEVSGLAALVATYMDGNNGAGLGDLMIYQYGATEDYMRYELGLAGVSEEDITTVVPYLTELYDAQARMVKYLAASQTSDNKKNLEQAQKDYAAAMAKVSTGKDSAAIVAALQKESAFYGNPQNVADTNKLKLNTLVMYAAENSKNLTVDEMVDNLVTKTYSDSVMYTNPTAQNTAEYALAYGAATAYAYANGLDTSNIRSYINTDGYREYVASEQGRADIQGYLSCMQLLTDNMDAGNIDYSYVAQNGFAANDITSALSQIFGQTTN